MSRRRIKMARRSKGGKYVGGHYSQSGRPRPALDIIRSEATKELPNKKKPPAKALRPKPLKAVCKDFTYGARAIAEEARTLGILLERVGNQWTFCDVRTDRRLVSYYPATNEYVDLDSGDTGTATDPWDALDVARTHQQLLESQ